MAEITWAMWNCSGILPTSSAQTKMDFLNACFSKKVDILILIETHHKALQEISSLLQTYTNNSSLIQTEATKEDPYAGIAVLINNNFTLLEHATLLQGRLLNFKIQCYKKVYNITAMYGFTSKNASQEKMEKMTTCLLQHHDISDNNVILGDFNFVENDLDRTNQSRSGKNQMDNTLSKPWNEFTDKSGLSDMLFVPLTQKDEHILTYTLRTRPRAE